MSALNIAPTKAHGRAAMASPVPCLQTYRRWLVVFEVDGAPFNITVMEETRHLAIEYAEGVLWLQLGKPTLDGFAPCCVSACEVH